MSADALLDDPWACGPFCWMIDDVRLFTTPLPCRGAQGLWRTQAEENAALRGLVPERGGVAWWPALTILQPFASAIAVGPKRVENRSWAISMPLSGGRWIGLHAGKALAGTQDEVLEALDLWRDPLFDGRWTQAPEFAALPRGFLLGAIHLSEVRSYPATP